MERVFPAWEDAEFVEPFAERHDRILQADAVRGLTAALRDELCAELNRRHMVEYSREFWHIVLTDWLIHLVMVSWRMWRHVELFVERFGVEPLQVELIEARSPIRFVDTVAFVEACYNQSDFRTLLISEIVRRLAPPGWQLLPSRQIEPIAVAPRPASVRRRGRVGEINGVVRWKRWLLSALVMALPKKPMRFGPLVPASKAGFPEAYCRYVTQLARTTLPETLGEGFSALDAAARARVYRPGRIRLLTVNVHDDELNIELGHAVAAGERIIDVQHGGVYGTGAMLPCAPDLEYCHDTFVTWGWMNHDRYQGRFRPLASPMLSQFAKRRRRSTSDIIFVGTMMAPFNPRVDYSSEPLEYRRWKRRFLARLEPKVHTNVRYRPYFSPRSIDDAAWLHRHFPNLRIVEGNLDEQLLVCRLAVLDYPGTTLAQTLAANIPTICFWDKERWLLSRLSEPLFDKLRQAGIVFHAPEEAASQLNAVAEDIESWWADPRRQSARVAWCHEYARADRHWLRQWLKALANV